MLSHLDPKCCKLRYFIEKLLAFMVHFIPWLVRYLHNPHHWVEGKGNDQISVVGLLIYLCYISTSMPLSLSISFRITSIAKLTDPWGNARQACALLVTWNDHSWGLLSTHCGQFRDQNTDQHGTCGSVRRNPTWGNVEQANLCIQPASLQHVGSYFESIHSVHCVLSRSLLRRPNAEYIHQYS